MDIRQSLPYARYMRSIGWNVETVGTSTVYRKQFPFIGSFIKIQRPDNETSIKHIQNYLSQHRTFRTIIEPNIQSKLVTGNMKHTTISPFSPTKTIHINLAPTEESIFKTFSPTTRRAIRKAEKHGVFVEESTDINTFARYKSAKLFPMHVFMQKDLIKLWHAFKPNHATILLAQRPTTYNKKLILAGILILFHEQTAYYWQAFSSPEGNILRAPSLLVWEALKISKKRRSILFDFEGIYDDRFPDAFAKWKGFTRFKKGFGGKEVEYPEPFSLQ